MPFPFKDLDNAVKKIEKEHNLKKITIPANGPGPHKEMAIRIGKLFKRDAWIVEDAPTSTQQQYIELTKDVLAIIKEYDIADAMRSFDKE